MLYVLKGVRILNSENLPMWLEYVRALGTPCAALLAALITGYFAYKQWKTARNKLKLDLFEKRFKVYDAGMEIIREVVKPSEGYGNRLTELTNAVSGARWLLSTEVDEHLKELLVRAWKRVALEKGLDENGISLEQREEEIADYHIDTQAFITSELDHLNKVFEKFLAVEH